MKNLMRKSCVIAGIVSCLVGVSAAQTFVEAAPQNVESTASNLWNDSIDPESVQYDKNNGIISFTTTKMNANNGVKIKAGFKLYIKENRIFRTGAVGYLPGHTEGFSYKGGKSLDLEPIPPDSYADKYQKDLYAYLGITSQFVNKPAKWEYIGFNEANNESLFIDVNNIRCDKNMGIVYAYGKAHSLRAGDRYDTYMLDVKNMKLWYFMVEGGKFCLEKNPPYWYDYYLNFAKDYYDKH